MSKITILDELTAGQIAAGEVVERPVSVVKELVENSLDAGAGRISVDISEGGRSGITVSDNGCGMSQEDVGLAFCRHATSKIRTAGDLYALSTLGFRGEALPSIAAVSRLLLQTREPGETEGCKIELEGGEVLTLGPAGCPPGTIVRVDNLFFNTPARRKHLKSRGTEAGLVAAAVQGMALARPEVGFTLRHNRRNVLRTPGSGVLLDVISSVYGAGVAREMAEIPAREEGIRLRGFVGKPSLSRKNRSYITVIINGRYVRSRAVSQAVEDAYVGLLPVGRRPVAVLVLDMDPALLDVNIHPAKMEVRIDGEGEVARLIRDCIRDCLQREVLIPDYRPRGGAGEDVPLTGPAGGADDPSTGPAAGETTFAGRGETPPAGRFEQGSLDYGRLRESTAIESDDAAKGTGYAKESFEPADSRTEVPPEEKGPEGERSLPDGAERESFPALHLIGRLEPTYLLTAGPGGLYIVDQHAAHERILFEEILDSLRSGEGCAQMLVTPVPVELNYRALAVLEENLSALSALGFVLDEFGEGSYVLRGVPAHLAGGEGAERLADVLEELGVLERERDFNRALAARLACKAAVKSGEGLSPRATEALLRQLSRVAQPYTCPHGRPTLVKITERELARMFKRVD